MGSSLAPRSALVIRTTCGDSSSIDHDHLETQQLHLQSEPLPTNHNERADGSNAETLWQQHIRSSPIICDMFLLADVPLQYEVAMDDDDGDDSNRRRDVDASPAQTTAAEQRQQLLLQSSIHLHDLHLQPCGRDNVVNLNLSGNNDQFKSKFSTISPTQSYYVTIPSCSLNIDGLLLPARVQSPTSAWRWNPNNDDIIATDSMSTSSSSSLSSTPFHHHDSINFLELDLSLTRSDWMQRYHHQRNEYAKGKYLSSISTVNNSNNDSNSNSNNSGSSSVNHLSDDSTSFAPTTLTGTAANEPITPIFCHTQFPGEEDESYQYRNRLDSRSASPRLLKLQQRNEKGFTDNRRVLTAMQALLEKEIQVTHRFMLAHSVIMCVLVAIMAWKFRFSRGRTPSSYQYQESSPLHEPMKHNQSRCGNNRHLPTLITISPDNLTEMDNGTDDSDISINNNLSPFSTGSTGARLRLPEKDVVQHNLPPMILSNPSANHGYSQEPPFRTENNSAALAAIQELKSRYLMRVDTKRRERSIFPKASPVPPPTFPSHILHSAAAAASTSPPLLPMSPHCLTSPYPHPRRMMKESCATAAESSVASPVYSFPPHSTASENPDPPIIPTERLPPSISITTATLPPLNLAATYILPTPITPTTGDHKERRRLTTNSVNAVEDCPCSSTSSVENRRTDFFTAMDPLNSYHNHNHNHSERSFTASLTTHPLRSQHCPSEEQEYPANARQPLTSLQVVSSSKRKPQQAQRLSSHSVLDEFWGRSR